MVIKSVVSRDREHILALLRRRGNFTEEEIRVALEVIDEALSCREPQDYHIYCAFDESGELAGYICFGPIPMTQDCYDLYWIAVEEKVSRKGVGAMLVRSMERFLAGKSARRIYVDTSSTPPYEAARSFYEKQGYRVACVLDDFYREGDHKMIFMKEVGIVVAQSP